MKNVLLLLCKGVEIYEAAAFFDVSGWSGEYGEEAVHVTTTSVKKNISATFGLKIQVDKLIAEIDTQNYDALAVPGGFESFGFYEDAFSEEVSDLIRRFYKQEKPVASICVGALALAKSGILENGRATTYHLASGKRQKQLAQFHVNVVDAPVVRHQKVITSSSPATALDVAFTLLTDLTGVKNAARIRYLMGFGKEEKE